jgi:benzodiazapine receptor
MKALLNDMNPPKRSVLIRDLGFGLVAIIVVAAASVVAQVATYPNLAPWYAGLVKPSFNPPNWVFGPVWTSALSNDGICRVAHSAAAGGICRARWALGLFIAQLALNAAWSWMFFAANDPLLGLINIVPQILVILATIVAFYRLDRMAGWCLVPLAAWVSFATILNFAIWKLNP